jgi:hypothetical protein
MVSAAVAFLPAAVSLLLLEALCMQISGVSLTLTWPCRLCLLRVLCMMPLLQAFPFPSTLGAVTLHPFSQACVFIYSSCGKWAFPPLLWSFPPTAAFTGFPAPDCWVVLLLLPAGVFVYSSLGWWVFPPLLWCFPPSATLTSFPTPGCWAFAPTPALSGQARLVYLQFGEGFPFPSLWRSVRPTLFATCLYCSYCLLLNFSFFPGWGSVCPGGCADLAQGCLWKYCIPLSSPCGLRLPKPSGRGHLGSGALLISPFNMKWRCSAQARGVEGSKFYLFSVALPARCVSSVSPRFHFRTRLSASSL